MLVKIFFAVVLAQAAVICALLVREFVLYAKTIRKIAAARRRP